MATNTKMILLSLVMLVMAMEPVFSGKILKKINRELKKIGYKNIENFLDDIGQNSVDIGDNILDIETVVDEIDSNQAHNDMAIGNVTMYIGNNADQIVSNKDHIDSNTMDIGNNTALIKEYHMPMILVSTGYPYSSATKTEIINTDSSLTCPDLDEYPLQVYGAVGSNMASLPVVCGGRDSSGTYHTQCYRMELGKWNLFGNLVKGRRYAAGISHAQSFVIFGGANSGILSSTEIVTEQGVSNGPEMPEAVWRHAIASVNKTVSILTGGISASGYSSKTWLFSHESNQFQAGPPLLTARSYHASSTIKDRITMENIVAVVGGYNGGYLDTTELLFNGESAWQQGPQLPKTLSYSSAVHIEGDLYTVGGHSADGSGDQTAIYRMTCWARNCTWTTLTQELKVARRSHVTIPIHNSYC